MQAEIDAAADDRVKTRETFARLQNRTALSYLSRRIAVATSAAVVALIVTGVALVASSFVDEERPVSGMLLLTSSGAAAVAEACPNLELDSAERATATLDVGQVGGDEPIRIFFPAGVCAKGTSELVLSGELVHGVLVD